MMPFLPLRRLRLAIIMACWLLPACATLPEPRQQAPVASEQGAALLDEWLLRGSRSQTLQGVAKVRVQTPGRTLNGTQVLLAESPSRLRAETLSPFGTPLLVMTVNDTELAVLAVGDNRFYRGRATPDNLGRFTRLPLRAADLVGILLYRPPLVAYRTLEAFRLEDGGWLLTLDDGDRRQELQFDRERRLTGVRYLYGAELQLRLGYGDFEADPQRPPRRIELELPLERIQADLAFRELETGRQPAPGLFTLSPPEGAMVTDLDDSSSPSAREESR